MRSTSCHPERAKRVEGSRPRRWPRFPRALRTIGPAPPGSFVGCASSGRRSLPVPCCKQPGTTSPNGGGKGRVGSDPMIAPLVMHPVGRRDEGIPPYASPSVPRHRGALRPCGRPCTPRHIRPERFGEFAACTNLPDLLSYCSPMPPGRPEAVPYGGDGAQCEYPWRCLNPTPRRRDPSSGPPPQDDNTGWCPVTAVGEGLVSRER